MFYLALILLLAHLIADFYTQSTIMVENKSGKYGRKKAAWGHITHVCEHFLAFCLGLFVWFYLMGGNFCHFSIPVLCLGAIYAVIHLITDVLKELTKKKFANKDLHLFMADQVIHLSTILIIVSIIYKFELLKFTPIKNEHIKGMTSIITIMCGLLILLRPVSLFVEKFLNMAMAETKITHIKVTKSHISKMLEENLKVKLNALMDDTSCAPAAVKKVYTDYKDRAEIIVSEIPNVDISIESKEAFTSNKGGQWIGYVERVMIFTFFMFGQFTAIAAMMAIKTAFRFNDLKDDNDSHRSEYIMLGTFVSLFMTFLVSLVVKHYISPGDLTKFIDSLINPFV
ncbi:DUF3307 domain-containing protein [Rahnella ecdela]|uniref:DUF3307 domain-containing protein n=1 Tax=Rahnella ecdela TaxID=2816250 RepID=A0ABS6LID4_9GAMM|nr:DUF3307 domain-containing protein [Rahnella ecdela]MBU9846697.1 DUF3307 domain-containing protein [Rahnella ecdela]